MDELLPKMASDQAREAFEWMVANQERAERERWTVKRVAKEAHGAGFTAGRASREGEVEECEKHAGLTGLYIGCVLCGLAEARAEVERLRDLIDEAGKPFLALDPGLKWEGAIDSAMAAACAEVERLRRERELF